MKKLFLMLLIAFVAIETANAQLNIGKLKDKIKNNEKKPEEKNTSQNTQSSETKTQSTGSAKEKETKNEQQDMSALTLDQLSNKTLDNGTYYSTRKDVKTVELKNCCTTGPIKFLQRTTNGINDREYKKSSYVENLFYNSYTATDFLYVYTEKGVILDFSTKTLMNGDKEYTITAVNMISMDDKIKRVDANACKDKVVAVLAELKQKKDAVAAEEEKKKLAERAAPVDKMKNPALTKQALVTLNEHALKEKYGYAYTKAWIVTSDWTIVKNQYTGAILYRLIEAEVLYTQNGKCYTDHFSLKQDYAGNAYQKNLVYNGIGTAHDEILCDKVK